MYTFNTADLITDVHIYTWEMKSQHAVHQLVLSSCTSHLQLLQDDIVVTKMLSLLSLSATVVLHALPSPIINVDQFHIKAELLSCEAAR